jgi:enoyl-CoA hydratase/carnithine racemase
MTTPLESSLSESGILTLTFNRPEKKNAFNQALYEGLVGALDEARDRGEVRVVLLRGAGGAFTSGNDLSDFMNDPPKDEDHVILQFLLRLVDFEKPLVAAVEGPAIGIGTTLLLHCDLVYASPSAKFALPFVKLGLVPEGGSSLLLPRLAGSVKAAELLLLAESFDADTALGMGLVNEVVEGQPVVDRAFQRATTLADRPMASLRAAKKLLRDPDREARRETILREARSFAERLTSPEAMEAFQAFFEKREPDFRKVEESS